MHPFNVRYSAILSRNRTNEDILMTLYPMYGVVRADLKFISVREHDLLVAENLHLALSQLRYQSIERTLWTDAVCINQENDREKELQIQCTPKIYGQADRIVVWLGEAADGSDRDCTSTQFSLTAKDAS